MTTPEASRVAHARRWFRRLGYAASEEAGVTVVATPEHPDTWDANWAMAGPAAEADALIAALDRHFPQGWQVVHTDAVTHAQVEARLALDGFAAQVTLIEMVAREVRHDAPAPEMIRVADAEWDRLARLVAIDQREGKRTGEHDEAVGAGLIDGMRRRLHSCDFWLIEADGCDVGYGMTVACPAGLGLIESLFTLPEHRGRGLMSGFIAAAARRLRDQGCDAVFLDAHAHDTPKRLYAPGLRAGGHDADLGPAAAGLTIGPPVPPRDGAKWTAEIFMRLRYRARVRITHHLARRLFGAWLLAVVAGLGVTGAVAAGAAWQALAEHAPSVQPRPAAIGYEADDHFPGAALLYLDAPPAPAGATGTIALPPVPVPAATALAIAAAEQGIVPARPFSMAAASGLDRARAMQCLTEAIYYEAASEPDSGQLAVAQVILNRARHPAFPATVCGVVYQGSAGPVCQFSFACDGAMARTPSRAGWARAARNAAAALGGYVQASVGLATHYHTYAVTPSWNRSLVMTDVIGAHFFHRWKGYWGTGSAFTQVYRGGEPLPGPHAKVAVPALTVAAAPSALPAPPSTVLPAWRETSVAAPAPVQPEDRLPPASQILDKWKDSGKPL